jgi:S-formylglutathione hydrolase FrmB
MTCGTVILPEGMKGPFPVLYLLHGGGGDHTEWTRFSRLESYVSKLPLIVVMPEGAYGWYVDSACERFASYDTVASRDWVQFMDSSFHTIPERNGRVIAGLSMGGFGALKLALKHLDLYCAASSLSGFFDLQDYSRWYADPSMEELEQIFGGPYLKSPDNVYRLAEKADKATLPAIRFDCGLSDDTLESNRRFHGHLESLGIIHTYAEHPGGHNWDYWDLHIQETLEYFMKILAA